MSRFLLTFLGLLFCFTALWAVSDNELIRLENEMQKHFESGQKEKFINAANRLKEASKETDDERLFYKAWGFEAIYEATQQESSKALDIAKSMMGYALENGSTYGEYAAMHTEAMILLQKQNYDAAETAFLKALDFRHRQFPNESAAEDLRELIKIANILGSLEKAKSYGNQLLAEPNLAPHHKGRTLYRLSNIAFEENNVEEFNHIYEEMNKLTKTDGIRTISLFTELNHHIINGNYKEALVLVDQLSPDTCAERKALIFHRLGDNEKAYEYMALYKHISDSLTRASHNKQLADIYLRMNNDRLRLEEEVLSNQNHQLRFRFYLTVGISLILILLFFIYKGQKFIRLLKHNNLMLDYGKQDAERILKDLKELSSYESMSELPLTMPVKVNKLCDCLTELTQKHCKKGVTTIFQTDVSDDFEVKTNSEALEKVLSRLLRCSFTYTQQGLIILKCTESSDNVKFCISYTSVGNSLHTLADAKTTDGEEDESYNIISMNISICQAICRLIHGNIWEDKSHAHGICFYLEIPKQP